MRIGSKLSFLLGIGVGYYLGTGASPERREQLDEMLHKVTDNPQVKRVRDTVRRNADDIAGAAGQRVERTVDAAGHRVADAVDTVGDKVEGTVAPGHSSSSSSSSSSYS